MGRPTARSPEASAAIDEQIQRLTSVVSQAESVLRTIQAAARGIGSGGGGGGGGPRRMAAKSNRPTPQNDVLLEIFKSNLDLRKQLEGGGPAPAAAPPAAPAPVAVAPEPPIEAAGSEAEASPGESIVAAAIEDDAGGAVASASADDESPTGSTP